MPSASPNWPGGSGAGLTLAADELNRRCYRSWLGTGPGRKHANPQGARRQVGYVWSPWESTRTPPDLTPAPGLPHWTGRRRPMTGAGASTPGCHTSADPTGPDGAATIVFGCSGPLTGRRPAEWLCQPDLAPGDGGVGADQPDPAVIPLVQRRHVVPWPGHRGARRAGSCPVPAHRPQIRALARGVGLDPGRSGQFSLGTGPADRRSR